MSNITFTSKIGKFIFAEGTPLSLAKLVRDTVTAQWLNPRPSELELNEVEDAYRYIGTHPSAQINRIHFELEMNPQALDSIKKDILNYAVVDTPSRNQHAYL